MNDKEFFGLLAKAGKLETDRILSSDEDGVNVEVVEGK